MKRLLIASTALVALSFGAVAADLPSRSAPVAAPFVPAAPAFTWTGFYAGVNAGYAWGDFTGNGGSLFDDGDGFVAGGQLGYNVQLGQFVVGLETDLQWTNFDAGPGVGILAGTTSEAELDYFGTVRARGGFAFDRALVYGTGGLAYGRSNVSIPGFSDDNMHLGWTIGAGAEYAFTNNLTAKVEYLYTDLANESVVLGPVTVNAGAEFSTVRGGLNFKF